MRRDDDAADKDKDLAAAKTKLSEVQGRPLDVDTLIARERAHAERERSARLKAEESLEKTYKDARERRHVLEAKELEQTTRALKEKVEKLESDKHLADKKTDKNQHPGGYHTDR